MKTLRQLCFSFVLITVLVAPALGGETQTPPGEIQSPPVTQGISETAPGETDGPPAIALLMYLIQPWLSAN
jgi:hypothetical protein